MAGLRSTEPLILVIATLSSAGKPVLAPVFGENLPEPCVLFVCFLFLLLHLITLHIAYH